MILKFIKSIVPLLLLSLACLSQTPNYNLTNSNERTTFGYQGPLTSNGYQVKNFADTFVLNAQPYLKGIPGLLVRVGNQLYYRNAQLTGWIPISFSAAPTDFNFVDSVVVYSNTICEWKKGVPKCYTISSGGGGNIFIGIDSITANITSICQWKNGVPNCYPLMGPGIDSVTLTADTVLCQWSSGIPGCYIIHGNVVQTGPTDSLKVTGNNYCWYFSGVPTCITINNVGRYYDSTSLNYDSTKYIHWNNGVKLDSIIAFSPIIGDTCILIRDSSNGKTYFYLNPNCRGSGTGGTPAGSNKEIQYNNAGAFGAQPYALLDSGLVLKPKKPVNTSTAQGYGYSTNGITYSPTDSIFVYEHVKLRDIYPKGADWYRGLYVAGNQNAPGALPDVNNPVYYEGYNFGPAGKIDTSKQSFGWSYETNYDKSYDSVSNTEIHLVHTPTNINPALLGERRLMSFQIRNGFGYGYKVGVPFAQYYMDIDNFDLRNQDSSAYPSVSYFQANRAGITLTGSRTVAAPEIIITPTTLPTTSISKNILQYNGNSILGVTNQGWIPLRSFVIGGNLDNIRTHAKTLTFADGEAFTDVHISSDAGGHVYVGNLATSAITFSNYDSTGVASDPTAKPIALIKNIANQSPSNPAGGSYMNPMGQELLNITINGADYKVPLITDGGQTAYSGYLTFPFGTVANRPTPWAGMYRLNQDSSANEFYINGSWFTGATRKWVRDNFGSGSGTVTSVATGYGVSGGTITGAGTIILDSATLSLKYLRRADSVFNPGFTSLFQHNKTRDSLQANINAKGSGTVTTVGFTGGLISVANPTTTPAFTVAGTSGGIPYFSSSSAWATSAALAANALVIGGGAGVAPSTTTTGTGILTFLGTPSSANLLAALTTKTGTGNAMFSISPTSTGLLTTDTVLTQRLNLSGSNFTSKINLPSTGSYTIANGIVWGPNDVALYQTSQFSIGTNGSLAVTGALIANSSLTVSSGNTAVTSFRTAYAAKTANYTIAANDYTINCTSGSFTVTLPTAASTAGQVYVITNSGAGTITIGTTSSQTFANVTATPTTLTMSTVGSRTVQSNGANWLLISSL